MGNFTSPAEDRHEVVSIFDTSYPFNMNPLGGMSTPSYDSCNESEHKGEWTCGIGMAYSAVSSYMGFGGLGAEQDGSFPIRQREDPNIRSFLADGFNVDSNLFIGLNTDVILFHMITYLTIEKALQILRIILKN